MKKHPTRNWVAWLSWDHVLLFSFAGTADDALVYARASAMEMGWRHYARGVSPLEEPLWQAVLRFSAVRVSQERGRAVTA